LSESLNESRDMSGTYNCECDSSTCLDPNEFKISYDKENLFVKAEGKSWIYSANVVRQESKVTGDVFLILPAGYSVMTSNQVIRMQPDGSLSLNGMQVRCTLE